MNLTHLRAFHVVAECGSVTRAAQLLHVTQPTLSAHIKGLEEHYDVMLFERRKQGLKLSNAGQLLHGITEPLFGLVERAEALLDDSAPLLSGQLRIAADAPAHVVPALAKLRRAHPQLQLALAAGNSAQVLQRVLSHDSDVAVLADVEAHPRLFIRHVKRDPVVMIVNRKHAWARRKSVALSALAGVPLVMREPGSITRAILLRALQTCALDAGPMLEIGSREGVREAVAAGLGAGAVFASEVGHDRRIVAVRVRHEALVGNEYLVCLAQRVRQPAISAFVRAMGVTL